MSFSPANIFYLGVKELWGLLRDPIMLVLIAYSFSISIYVQATGTPETLEKASLAIIDEDLSPLTRQISMAFYPPYFLPPYAESMKGADTGMDRGIYTFSIDFPPNLQRDLLNGRNPSIQLNVDATRMSQAFTGGGYIQTIINNEVSSFLKRYTSQTTLPISLAMRARFNPNLIQAWFSSVVAVINSVTMLSLILTGAALIREREHGTIEHLLVMPITPFEIMVAKIWSMGLVVLAACMFSLLFIVQLAMQVPVAGSVPLFLAGTALNLFACTSLGIFLATFAKTMPQFALLIMLVLLPLQMLSGGMTPRESMPAFVQDIMLAAPTTHFVMLAQGILYRGAGLEGVWPQFLALAIIGSIFFTIALQQFSKRIGSMA
ncbi:ABC transporter permease [Entomobacter blattae]|uniref:Inner membrane transport permease YhhJ n=1 Tax=Entomobacter blattae TaxID=2762277 RepID=A0A7H1NRH9_9PROT|nr:ABC transporter permease [Entomobacter blattae]QNT78389.1 Inner membrane transport permease YhhJ [Entomobacter blattae]